MNKEKSIAIVDDDPNIAELMKLYFEKEGYISYVFYDGIKFLESAHAKAYDLVLLDIMLPELDGYEVLREFRKKRDTAVIMVTAKGETFDKVLCLELGADDYLVKPFDPKELIARARAVIRRYADTTLESQVLHFVELDIDMNDYHVTYKNQMLEMPPKEIELLYFLASNPNRVFTREQLLDKIWGYDYAGESRTVDVHIKRLREKLNGEHQRWEIKTVWGVGYKFRLD